MPELSPEFQEALRDVFGLLAERLDRPQPFNLRLDPTAHAPRIQANDILIPVHYEVHWRRFRAVPTELAREAALAALRAHRPAMDLADRMAFVEAFVRDALLWSD